MINHRYKVLKEIGKGRSHVFLCYDVLNKINVSVKILSHKRSELEKENLRNEHLVLRTFNHPNIIKSYDFGIVLTADPTLEDRFQIEPTDLYIALEYFEGYNLVGVINELTEMEVDSLIYSLCCALFYIHQSNYIYGDLKPENILYKRSTNEIKLIDFGLSFHKSKKRDKIFGSLKFMAPEVLNNEPLSYKVDLYSLGALLYKIIFNKHHISSDNEIDIYKEQIAGKIDFPQNEKSQKYISVIKKLLQSNPENRFSSSLLVLKSLGIPIKDDVWMGWSAATVFVGREEILKHTADFIADPINNKPILFVGPSNSGKSFLLREICRKNENCILISSEQFFHFLPEEKQLLKLICFNKVVFPNLTEELRKKIAQIIFSPDKVNIEKYLAVLGEMSKSKNFILLVDEVSTFEPIVIEMLSLILPILVVNGVKVLIAEKQTTSLKNDFYPSLDIIHLKPFSEVETKEFIETNCSDLMPQRSLLGIIQEYTDLQPGNIKKFIEILVRNYLLLYDFDEGFILKNVNDISKIVSLSNNELVVYHKKILTEDEIEFIRILAILNNPLNISIVTSIQKQLFRKSGIRIPKLVEENILQLNISNNTYEFYSRNYKDYIVSDIANVQPYHILIAGWLVGANINVSNYVIAYHYELAKDYENCFKHYYIEINKAKKVPTHKYIIELLSHLLTLPFEEDKLNKIKTDLSEEYLLHGDYNSCYSISDEALTGNLTHEERRALLIRKGTVLINLGELQSGIDTLNEILDDISDIQERCEVLVSIGYANLQLGKYDEALSICESITSQNEIKAETRGEASILIGLMEFYNNNPTPAINKFNDAINLFNIENLTNRICGAKINIGNVYAMKGDLVNAQLFWSEALELNKLNGNLEREGKLLLNYGVLYYDLAEYDKSITMYTRAKTIFENLGDKNSYGIAIANLAEVNFKICNYDLSVEYLSKAKLIFNDIGNYVELAEVLLLEGKILFILCEASRLFPILNELNKLSENKLLPTSYNKKIELLKGLIKLSSDEKKTAIELLTNSLDELALSDERDSNYNYAFISFLLVNLFIEMKLLDKAESLLTDKKLSEFAKNNIFVGIEMDYWAAFFKMKIKTQDSFDDIQRALEKLKNINITPLSWRVIFLAGKYFVKRGNYYKAEKYYYLTQAMVLKIKNTLDVENLSSYAKLNDELNLILKDITKFELKYSS